MPSLVQHASFRQCMPVYLATIITLLSATKPMSWGTMGQLFKAELPPSLSLRKQISEQEVASEETNFGRMCTEKSQTECLWIKLIKKQLDMTVYWNQNQGMK